MLLKLQRFFFGLITALILLFILGGAEAIQALVTTIICTLGITLIAYIPIAYLIGLGIEKIFYSITGRQSSIEMTSELNSADQAVVNYITDARNAGMSNEIIRSNLKENGWATEAIDKAFSIVNSKNK
ncbi:MAG: hypothetical protein WCO05_00240 [Candidatus Moraniibacteriota bacterium]|jgi:hypothetical protein